MQQSDGLESSNKLLQHSPSSSRTPAPRCGSFHMHQRVWALQPSAGPVQRPMEESSPGTAASSSLRWQTGYTSAIRLQCIQFKIVGREPEDLVFGFDKRLQALAEAGGCSLPHIYVRRGCIELSLDLERGSEGSRLEDVMTDNDERTDSGSEYSGPGAGGSRSVPGAGAGGRGVRGVHVIVSGAASGAETEGSSAGHLVPGRLDLGTPEAAPSLTQIVFRSAESLADAATAAASTGSSRAFVLPSTVVVSPEPTGSLPLRHLWTEAEPEPAERRNAPPHDSGVSAGTPFGGASPGAGDAAGAVADTGGGASLAHGGGGDAGGATVDSHRGLSEAGHRCPAGVSAVAFAQACFAPQARAPAIAHLHPRVVGLLWDTAGSATPSILLQRQQHQRQQQRQQQQKQQKQQQRQQQQRHHQQQGSAPTGRSDCGGCSGSGGGAAATAASHGGEEAAGQGGRTQGARDYPVTPIPGYLPAEVPTAGGLIAGRSHVSGPAAALTLHVRITVPASGHPSESLTRVHCSCSAPAGGGVQGGRPISWGPPGLPPDPHEPPPLELLLRCAGRYIPCDITGVAATAAAASETAAAGAVGAVAGAAVADVELLSAEDDHAPAGGGNTGGGNASGDMDKRVSYDYAVTLLEPPPVSCGVLLVDLRWRGRPCHVAPLLLVDDPCVVTELSAVAATWTGPPHELDGLLYDMGAWVRCMAARRVAGAAAAARAVPWAAAGTAQRAASAVAAAETAGPGAGAAAGAVRPGVVGPEPLCLPVLGASLLQFAHGHGLLGMAARLQMDMRLCGYTAPFRPLLRNGPPVAAVLQLPQHPPALLPRSEQPSSLLGVVASRRPAATPAPAAHSAEALHRLCAEEAPAERPGAQGPAVPAATPRPRPRPAGAGAASLAPITANCRPGAGVRQGTEPTNEAAAPQGQGTHTQAAAAVQAVPPLVQLVERGVRGPGRGPYGSSWVPPWRRLVAAVKATLRLRTSRAEEESYQQFAESYCTTVSCLLQLIDLLSLLELLLRLVPAAFGAGRAAAADRHATRAAPCSSVDLMIVMTSLLAAANGLTWHILPPRAWRRVALCTKLVRHCCLTTGRLVSMSTVVAHPGLQVDGPGRAALIMEAVIMPAACLLSPASAMLLAALKLPLYVAVWYGAALSATLAVARASIAATGSGAPTGLLELVVSDRGTGGAGGALADMSRAVVLTVGPLLTTLACHVYLRLQFQRQQEAARYRGGVVK